MENDTLIILATAFCVILLLIVPNIPYTASQFFFQNTDLNYTKVLNGDYNQEYLYFDGNTISSKDINFPAPDINLSYADATFVPYVDAVKDVNINDFNLILGKNIFLDDQDNNLHSNSGVIYKDNIPFIHNYVAPIGVNGFNVIGLNTFMGLYAGNLNIGKGTRSTDSLGSSSYNTGVGWGALGDLNKGGKNTALGYTALSKLKDAYGQIAIGSTAMGNVITCGSNNVAIGERALYSLNNVNASYNVGIGYFAGTNMTSGQNNIAIGYTAIGGAVTTGNFNTCLGSSSCNLLTSGSNNVGIGANTLSHITTVSNELCIGVDSCHNTTGLGNIGLGGSALNGNTSGVSNIAIGYFSGNYYGASGTNAKTTGNNAIYIGNNVRASALAITNEIAIGEGIVGMGSNTTVIGKLDQNFVYLRGDLVIGQGQVNKDYNLVFDGNKLDGIITWVEDKNYFNLNDSVIVEKDVNALRFCIGSSCLSSVVDDDSNYRTWDNNTFTNAKVTLDLNVNKNLYVDGNIFGSGMYGGDWNKLDGGFEVVDLVTTDVYVRATRRIGTNLNGVTIADGNLVVQYGGMYMATVSASVFANSSQFGMKGFVNDTGMNNCYSHFHTSVGDTSNPNFNCLVRLNAGQNFNVRFDDHSNPVNDLTLESMNITILRVGN